MKQRHQIYHRLRLHERLSRDDAVFLYRHANILEIAQLANERRELLHGNKTYFIKNKHIDYSNVCVLSCRFCAFARKKGQDGAFENSIEQILAKVRLGVPDGIREVHIVGGFHPTLPYAFYKDMLSSIKREFPTIHIKAFTAPEISYFSKKFRMTEEQILKDLIDCGLGSLPGGGAEIFAPRVRQEICGPKGDADGWLKTHELAHALGLNSNATMLYGHIETIEERVDHLARLRDLQDKTGGFLCFIPLAFNSISRNFKVDRARAHFSHDGETQPRQSQVSNLQGTKYEVVGITSAYDDLKIMAISRLFLDNIAHIKAYWVMAGMAVAQMAQFYGADDLHGTVIEENITHMAGGKTPQGYKANELCRVIAASGRVPVERDSLYREIA
ncbi:MAG: aminofutalosine synthase MqnE [Deltaproteobacteria bacterium]|nr:aminofutalosine synthase MqnE [Deltaproteobacteria bacterium]